MVGGQVLDMEAEGRAAGADEVRAIHASKTGALLAAAAMLGVRAAGADPQTWERFAARIGRLFQATDDLLDATGSTVELGKTAGKDAAAGKATMVAALGLDGARAYALDLAAAAGQALEELAAGPAAPKSRYDELQALPGLLVDRCR